MADVQLGHLVVGEVERLVAARVQLARQRRRVAPRVDADADEDVRLLAAVQAVVELGDDALAERDAEVAIGAGPLRDRHREQRLALLAELGALGDEAQPIEVHVGAAEDRDQVLVVAPVGGHPALEAGQRERAGRLHHAARVVEDVLDGGAHLVVRDAHDLVDGELRDLERVHADGAHRDAVGEDADVVERDAPAGLQRLVHRVRLERLDADDADVGQHGLDVAGDAGEQAAAADRHEHRVQRLALPVPDDLVADGALPGDDQRIVERVDEREPGLGDQAIAVGLRVRVAVADEDDLGAARLHRLAP